MTNPTKRQKQLLEYIADNPNSSLKDLVINLELASNRSAIDMIALLVKSGRLKKTGKRTMDVVAVRPYKQINYFGQWPRNEFGGTA